MNLSELESVQIRFTEFETQSPIQPVGRLTRRTRREIDGDGTMDSSVIERRLVQSLAGPMTPRAFIDHHVLDPSPNSRGDAEHRQSE